MMKLLFFVLLNLQAILCRMVFAEFSTTAEHAIVSMAADYHVGPIPPDATHSVVAAWIGLSPWGHCLHPINYGVLQPVLTYGATCVKYQPPDPYQWWISGQYVNTNLDCHHVPEQFQKQCAKYSDKYRPVCPNVGHYLVIQPGDTLRATIEYQPAKSLWHQFIEYNHAAHWPFDIALDYCSNSSEKNASVYKSPQEQNNAFLVIETYNYSKAVTMRFSNIVLAIRNRNPKLQCQDLLQEQPLPNNGTRCRNVQTTSHADNITICVIPDCIIHKERNGPKLLIKV